MVSSFFNYLGDSSNIEKLHETIDRLCFRLNLYRKSIEAEMEIYEAQLILHKIKNNKTLENIEEEITSWCEEESDDDEELSQGEINMINLWENSENNEE